MSEIRCQFIILAQKDEPTPDYAKRRTDTEFREGNPVSEIRCQFIILAQKDEPTPDYAKRRTDTEFRAEFRCQDTEFRREFRAG